MMDLHSRMERLAGTIEDTPAAVIQDDLARGRRAVRRRRTAQVTAGSVFGVAAVAAALSLTVGFGGAPAVSPPVVAGNAPGATTATGGIRLVGYTGKQPDLFTIDTVPQGFFIQGQNEFELVLAPQAAKIPDPAKPDLADPRVYTDKIAVYLQDKEYTADPEGDEQLTIGGKPAALRSVASDGTGFTQIYVVQAPRVYLTVQFDGSTGLTRAQMIEVAAGINLTPEAVAKAEAAYAAHKDNPKIHDN